MQFDKQIYFAESTTCRERLAQNNRKQPRIKFLIEINDRNEYCKRYMGEARTFSLCHVHHAYPKHSHSPPRGPVDQPCIENPPNSEPHTHMGHQIIPSRKTCHYLGATVQKQAQN
ncbi:unnamed protein product [Ectocarpus sp. 12 AP-2014]